MDKNLEILKKSHTIAYNKIQSSNENSEIEVFESKTGHSVPIVNKEGKKLYIHSRFDPYKEASRFVEGIETDRFNLFIVLGFGFGYHIELLMERIRDDSIILVIEKNPDIFKTALCHRDFIKILDDERLIILVDPDEDIITDSLKGKSSRQVSFITHRGSHQIYPEYYGNMLEISRSYVSTKEVNIATLAKFEKIWSSNLSRNVGHFINTPGANIFFDKFKDLPAIVVAAGPSLTMSLDFIKQNINKCLVIAVDTSYGILKKNNIEPHFCISVDPQVINARYFEGDKKGKTILVSDPTVHPSVYRLFRGRLVTTSVAFDSMKWIERLTAEKGELAHGGSVSTSAYDFAKKLGASPVIIVGQDLAFTGGLAHARGSYLDEQIHIRTNRLHNVQMFNRFQLTALPKIYVRGIKSDRVQTNQKMMIFLSWFEKRMDNSLINLTYDGAHINGVDHKDAGDLAGAIFNTDVGPVIEKIYKLGFNSLGDPAIYSKKLKERIMEMTKDINSLIPILQKAVGFSDNLQSLMKIKKEKRDSGKLNYILGKLSETDKVIQSKENIKDMISFTIQRVIHTITEGYDIDEDDEKLNEDELTAKRSQYLYRGLLEGTIFNMNIFNKMLKILNA
ncbi:motility associated factor glycosyltransferase family protein [Spirochaetota bacterium]